MRSLTCSLGLLLAALSGPALAEPAPHPAPQPAEASHRVSPATAAALARVVAPLDILLPVELEQARKAILALPTLDHDARRLEREYPGLYAALWAAIEPEMRRSTKADFPSFWAALERLYLARLTEGEAQAVMTFFKSPTGRKLIRNTYGSVDAAPIFAEMVKSENYVVDHKQLEAITEAATEKAAEKIGPEDQADLWILMASIDLEKFQAIGAETRNVTLDWVNKEDPEGDARLARMMEEAMMRYMAAHPPKE